MGDLFAQRFDFSAICPLIRTPFLNSCFVTMIRTIQSIRSGIVFVFCLYLGLGIHMDIDACTYRLGEKVAMIANKINQMF